MVKEGPFQKYRSHCHQNSPYLPYSNSNGILIGNGIIQSGLCRYLIEKFNKGYK